MIYPSVIHLNTKIAFYMWSSVFKTDRAPEQEEEENAGNVKENYDDVTFILSVETGVVNKEVFELVAVRIQARLLDVEFRIKFGRKLKKKRKNK